MASIQSKIRIGNDDNIDQLINQTTISVVKLGAAWCGPCKMLEPILVKLAEEIETVNFIEIDVDDNNAKDCVAKYQVNSVPLMIFYKDGQEVKRIAGFRPEQEIVNIINNL